MLILKLDCIEEYEVEQRKLPQQVYEVRIAAESIENYYTVISRHGREYTRIMTKAGEEYISDVSIEKLDNLLNGVATILYGG